MGDVTGLVERLEVIAVLLEGLGSDKCALGSELLRDQLKDGISDAAAKPE